MGIKFQFVNNSCLMTINLLKYDVWNEILNLFNAVINDTLTTS